MRFVSESQVRTRLRAGGKEIRTLGPPSEGLRFFRNSPVQFGNSPSESKTSSFGTGTAGPFPPCRLRTCNRPGIDPVQRVGTDIGRSDKTYGQMTEQPYRETWPLRGRS